MTNKKFWDNSSMQGEIKWDNQTLPGLTDEELYSTNWNLKKTESDKQLLSKLLKGKSLEDLVGKEKADQGKRKRREAFLGKKRPADVVERIVKTKKDNNAYGKSMLGKNHNSETKKIMAEKAKIRQQIKAELGLKKNECVPKDILIQKYIELGIE